MGIQASWGEDTFVVFYNSYDGLGASNGAADPSLVATASLVGHLEYDQSFMITGGTGGGFISSFLENQSDSGGGATCGVSIDTGETSSTAPRFTVPFTFGVPFTVQIFADVNLQVRAPYLYNPSNGGGCSPVNGSVQLFDSQGQALTNFDAEPVPEPRTWPLLSAGLFGFWLMKPKRRAARL